MRCFVTRPGTVKEEEMEINTLEDLEEIVQEVFGDVAVVQKTDKGLAVFETDYR